MSDPISRKADTAAESAAAASAALPQQEGKS